MAFTATITDLDADSMPLWESFGHPTAEDAHQAALEQIHTDEVADHLRGGEAGVYEIWSSADGSGTPQRVGTLTVVAAGG